MNTNIFKKKPKPKTNSIKILLRDINGKRNEVECDNHCDVLDWIESCSIDDENYEILLVTQGSVCLYSALGTNTPLSIDDMMGFFA